MSLPCQQILATPLQMQSQFPYLHCPVPHILYRFLVFKWILLFVMNQIQFQKMRMNQMMVLKISVPVDPEESYTDPGMRSEFLLQ